VIRRTRPDIRPAVAQLGPDRGTGGIGTLIEALDASSLSKRYRIAAITTYRTPRPLQRLFVFAGALWVTGGWRLGAGPHLIHVHAAVGGSWYRKALLVVLARATRTPVVLHVHSGPLALRRFHDSIGVIRRGVLRRIFARADAIITVSRASAEALASCWLLDNVRVVPNAIPPIAAPTAVGTALDERALTVLYVGGFFDRLKGGELLLGVLPRVLRSSPELVVRLIGPGEFPRHYEPLLDDPHVRWEGWLGEQAKGDAFRDADIFVLPALSEGHPIALLEALQYGCAIVATCVGGVPDAVSHEHEALLVEPGAGDALADELIRVANDDGLRERLRAAALRRAVSFSFDDYLERLDALYREVLERSVADPSNLVAEEVEPWHASSTS
jgi:glycosyltransferase involved in cell wall biosynthesis